MDQVVCREKYGSESLRKSYIRGPGDQLRAVDSSRGFNSVSSFFRVRRFTQVQYVDTRCHGMGWSRSEIVLRESVLLY